MMLPSLAQFDRPDEIFPFLLGLVVFLIPIIAILTRHQQRMAQILRDQRGGEPTAEIEALRSEVARLTQAVHQQTIMLDSMNRTAFETPPLVQEPPSAPQVLGR